MVSENPSSVLGRSDRGMVTEETVVAAVGRSDELPGYPFPSFWGSIVAGTMVVLGIGALSECLMFGCHVGTYSNGEVALGAGAFIWMLVTTCIAYFVGASLASGLSVGGGWMRGLSLWGFSIAFFAVLGAFISGTGGSIVAHGSQMADQFSSNSHLYYGGNVFMDFRAAWMTFIMLGLGLIFSLIGATVGRPSMFGQTAASKP